MRENSYRLTTSALFVYGTLKCMLIALFVVTIMSVEPVHAGMEKTCSGSDLLGELDPDTLATLQAKAAKTPFANARMFKISKVGLPDSWLFGTMHLADRDITALPINVQYAYDNAQAIMVEITDVTDKKKLMETVLKLKHLIYRQDGKTIAEEVSPEMMQKVEAAIRARAMPYELAIRMQPWMLSPAITTQLCEVEAKKAGKLFLDAKIMQMASRDGKPLIALETMREQLEVLSDMPRDFHINALQESLALGPRLDDLKQSMKKLYIDGQIGMIIPLIRHVSKKFANSNQYAEFLSKLLSKRNHTMVERAKEHFAKGNAFMAVGALHLPGISGVAALLQAEGYTITAVSSPAKNQ